MAYTRCKAIRQNDEYVCNACTLRWHVKESSPCKLSGWNPDYTIYDEVTEFPKQFVKGEFVDNAYRKAKDGE